MTSNDIIWRQGSRRECPLLTSDSLCQLDYHFLNEFDVKWHRIWSAARTQISNLCSAEGVYYYLSCLRYLTTLLSLPILPIFTLLLLTIPYYLTIFLTLPYSYCYLSDYCDHNMGNRLSCCGLQRRDRSECYGAGTEVPIEVYRASCEASSTSREHSLDDANCNRRRNATETVSDCSLSPDLSSFSALSSLSSSSSLCSVSSLSSLSAFSSLAFSSPLYSVSPLSSLSAPSSLVSPIVLEQRDMVRSSRKRFVLQYTFATKTEQKIKVRTYTIKVTKETMLGLLQIAMRMKSNRKNHQKSIGWRKRLLLRWTARKPELPFEFGRNCAVKKWLQNLLENIWKYTWEAEGNASALQTIRGEETVEERVLRVIRIQREQMLR